ncbi:MAG: acyltransferase [Chlorobium sp.]|nr:MAG: acyltransferase [Chlorobium sp.]
MGLWRLILAWLVIAVHTQGYEKLFVVEIGTIAVATFFFISGFLMPLAYTEHYESYGFINGIRRFYINRFLRIFPLYWVSCLLMTPTFFIGENSVFSGHPLTVELLNPVIWLQNIILLGLNQSQMWGAYYRINNPAWTLDVELQYYLLVPVIILLSARFRVVVSTFLIVALFVSIYLFFFPAGLVDIDRSFLSWSFCFILGYAFHRLEKMQLLFKTKRVSVTVSAIILLAAFVLDNEKIVSFLFILSFISFSAYLLVKQKEYKFSGYDKFIGDLSYPTYILHSFALGKINSTLFNTGISDYISRKSPIAAYGITLFLNIGLSTFLAYFCLMSLIKPIERFRASFKATVPIIQGV